MFILIEVIDREISMPIFFPTHEKAWDKMVSLMAERPNVEDTVEEIKLSFKCGIYDNGEYGIYANSAWINDDKHGHSDWQIYEITEELI